MLNPWLVGILWMKVLISLLSIISISFGIFNNFESYSWLDCIGILVAVAAICGVYMITQADKMGFYIFVGAECLLALIAYDQYLNISPTQFSYSYNGSLDYAYRYARNTALNSVWSNLGQIVFVMLLLLLRKNGKNAYQVLWDK